jgi:alkanesulfonate monooxygenase SsuD/methylene tetrahydromethanopterin reductase-like flavin-dependent oxidoreductase (luciferase family)
LRFSIKVPQHETTFDEMLACWTQADHLGFDAAWLADHFIPGFGSSAGIACDEGWVLLAALLARSERIRGGLLVTANTYRHPALLANMAATADRLSGGRLEMGLGAGWLAQEHHMYGLPYPSAATRIKQLAEACQVLKQLWTQPRSNFDGAYYQLRDALCEPKPVQQPYPRLVLGGEGERFMLRVVVEHADEWNYSAMLPAFKAFYASSIEGGPAVTSPSAAPAAALIAAYKHTLAALDSHLAAVGREPHTLRRSVQLVATEPWADLVSTVCNFIALGADHLIFHPGLRAYDASQLATLWGNVIPAIRDRVGR